MTTNPADDLASKILEKENSDRQEIALLLDNYLGKDDRIFVQKTQMGNSEAYIGSVTLEWLDSRVRFASQMPLSAKNSTSKPTTSSATTKPLMKLSSVP